MGDRAATRLAGLTVLALESRRANEMGELIRRHGGLPLLAPALRETPLVDNKAALAFVAELERGAVDVIILLTGVGTRMLAPAVEHRYPRETLAALLQRHKIVARGGKPAAALRKMGLSPTLTVPEPNTWREVLSTLDRELPVAGLRVAVQEYGQSNPELLAGLRERGATVLPVPLYDWELPEDTTPLRRAIAAIGQGQVDIMLCTSAAQVDHLFLVARLEGVEATHLRNALQRVVIASIGPVCTAALEAHGLRADLQPAQPQMGKLVLAVAQRGRELLAARRGARAADRPARNAG